MTLAHLARLALVALLSLSLSGCAASMQFLYSDTHEYVQPMQVNGKTFCTAFSINEVEGLWATAGHCVAAGTLYVMLGQRVTIHGVDYTPIYLDTVYDVAVMQSTLRARAVPLAMTAPGLEDMVRIKGYPYGLPSLIHVRGYVAGKSVTIDATIPPADVLDITVAGGNSGSPVLNSRGELVGVLWGKFNASGHSLSVPYHAVTRILAPFM